MLITEKIKEYQMTAEYYVLRLYRNSASKLHSVLGTLEEASSGIRWSFKNDDELHQVINEMTRLDSEQINDD